MKTDHHHHQLFSRRAMLGHGLGGLRGVLAEDRAGDQYRGRALAAVEQERGERRALVAGAEDVGRADIAGADLSDVAVPGETAEDQPERNGAQKVTGR